MSDPKRHHYVQRAYLDHWSDDSGDIYICDLTNGKVYKGPAKSAAWQKYYYSIDDPEQPEYKYEIEKFLGDEVESPAAKIFEKLKTNSNITSQEKNQLALYIAFQKVRVPAFEKFANQLAEKIDKEKVLSIAKDEQLFEKFLADNADKYKGENKPDRQKIIDTIEKGRVVVKYPRGHSLKAMMALSIPMSDLYARSGWLFLGINHSGFITSDNPVSTISMLRSDGGTTTGESSFPIYPHLALIISQDTPDIVGHMEQDTNEVEEINRRTLLHASRYLFGNDPDLLNKCYQEFIRLKPLYDKMQNNVDREPLVYKEKLFIKRAWPTH